ncbi:hypothetical protein BUALT_Bualt02G0163300 [Buddleja alternifolia]|uniref:Bifunctional inhibitor/plant lipid transfer protein/seed storage helical domain-containing protein n=1 Tax=Buddleja alternifolia TaxID=168488 RepID=A0AAV6Y4X5_9LAMI|nr:hypothetical protein BUALT_Bualt02G0163300 [Buddleja alternifolia]
MAISKMILMVYVTLFCANIVFLTTTNMVSAQCKGDFNGLIQQCSKYVQKQGPKQNPSQECCNVVKTVDLPCVCQHITPEVEQIISMEKAAFVAGVCGKPLPKGTKCGSYIVHEGRE